MSYFKNIKERLYIGKQWLGMMFLYPKLSIQKVDYDAYWKDKRGRAIGALSDWQKERADITVSALKLLARPLSIVDIGCGDGSILQYIKNNRPVSKMIGVDISDFALEKAREFGVETHKIDITDSKEIGKIPPADIALMFEILEHIPHSEEFLKNVYEKSGTGVLFSFPNSGFFVHRFRMLFGRFPAQWRLHPGEHLRFWTTADLKWWLESLGYKNRKIFFYKGFSGLNKIWPAMFAAGFVVYLEK